MPDDRSKLEQLDLKSITLEDLRALKSSALRDALVELVRNPEALAASGHQNHGSHGNHSTDASSFLQTELAQKAIQKAGPKG